MNLAGRLTIVGADDTKRRLIHSADLVAEWNLSLPAAKLARVPFDPRKRRPHAFVPSEDSCGTARISPCAPAPAARGRASPLPIPSGTTVETHDDLTAPLEEVSIQLFGCAPAIEMPLPR